MIRRLLILAAIYVGVILFFAIIYCSLSDSFKFSNDPKASFQIVDSLYLSMLTMSTLGYGDIYPIDSTTKVLTALQSIIGLVTFGWLLNIFWDYVLKKRNENANLNMLNTYKPYLLSIINSYRLLLIEITTDGQKDFKLQLSDLNPKFSDLSNLFKVPISSEHFYDHLLPLYIERHGELKEEFKYFLSNFDFTNHNELSVKVLKLIQEMNTFDSIHTLKSISGMIENQRKEYYLANNSAEMNNPQYQDSLNQFYIQLIEKYDECPELSNGPTGNIDTLLLVNIVKLYNSICSQIKNLSEIQIQLNLTSKK